jgi:hypothetical protein
MELNPDGNVRIRWLTFAFIVVVNVASAVALLGYLCIVLTPSHISSAQRKVLDFEYAIVGISLLVAWIGCVAAAAGVWVFWKPQSGRDSGAKFWLVVSLIVTVLVTLAHVTTVRFESIGQ